MLQVSRAPGSCLSKALWEEPSAASDSSTLVVWNDACPEETNPIKAPTGEFTPTNVATPTLIHPFGLLNSRRGEPPILVGEYIHKGMRITMPRMWHTTKMPSTKGSLFARKVLNMMATERSAMVSSDPCHL